MIPNILIYQDYVHNQALLHQSVAGLYGADNVGYADADDILDGLLNPRVGLFIMPGGADLYYAEKLNGAGNALIRAYVENGGTYLGICAGAYYGCRALEWAANESTAAITGARELAFAPVTARGPVYDFIEERDFKKSWLAAVPLAYDDGRTRIESTVCYEGGPVFEESANVTVLARYGSLEGRPPAIIETRVGAGKAVLCSPHLERASLLLEKATYQHRNTAYTRQKDAIAALKAYDTLNRKIWISLLERSMQRP